MSADPKRMVLVHKRWRTVHELRADGTTLCGNATGASKTAADLASYELLRADSLPPRARACERCSWILDH